MNRPDAPVAPRPPDGTRPASVLILGSGALRIGQAGEFDYSGSQALKALREEGIRTILVNPNVATIQTTPGLADQLYLLPVEADVIRAVLERERPEGILLGFGGQSALNAGLDLARAGDLARLGVAVLGTPVTAIETTEDRAAFAAAMRAIGMAVPRSEQVETVEAALDAAASIGYPVMARAGYSLGGLGSGIARDRRELAGRAEAALALSPQLLIEEYLAGWREIEVEVVRDRHGNAVTVCNLENLDPMGIHTGESIVVAPSQTLDDAEYHRLRSASLAIVDALGIVGECNVQFALHKESGESRVIEVNARLSRSSALASKATGYPLAWVAAKLALGHSLAGLRNAVTGVTGCFFEPALDYVTVKMPRWDLHKFRAASRRIGSEMKSVGEVMAIGFTFEEALQKAVRSLGLGYDGLTDPRASVPDPWAEIEPPTDRRLFALTQLLRAGATVADLETKTGIHSWFLERIASIAGADREIEACGCAPDRIAAPAGGETPAGETAGGTTGGHPSAPLAALDPARLRGWKQLGFSDRALARHLGGGEAAVRARRLELDLRPHVRRIDTLAGEVPASTNYLYLTYGADQAEIPPEPAGRPVVVLGGGPYSIGSSVEFDWCSVGACATARAAGHRTVLINCNPETVSTDYDLTDRLYFEELSLERVLDIVDFERPLGVIVSVGGQVPNNLAPHLHRAGVRILGTHPEMIDRAENRHLFSELLDRLGVRQPPWRELTSLEDARGFAAEVGYPVLIRPSYVLSGSAMNIARTPRSLEQYLERAASVSPESPVVISKFIDGAKEIEIDAVAQDGTMVLYAITEHVELSGVHSGDATVVLPPQAVFLETVRRAKRIARRIAQSLAITGPFNVQFLARQNELSVIECNVRASRSFPFVSKATGHDFIEVATRAMLGLDVRGEYRTLDLDHVAVKVPQFSFSRLKGADPVLYVEMTSTGEAACLGDSLEEAFLKALIANGFRLPRRSVLLTVGSEEHKVKLLEPARALADAGLTLYATSGTHAFLQTHGVAALLVHKESEARHPSVVDLVRDGTVECVINVPLRAGDDDTLTDGYAIRRAAADRGVPLLNDAELARLFVRAYLAFRDGGLQPRALSDYLVG